MKIKYWEKLLSHRGRGFNFEENTLEVVRKIISLDIKYVEIDVRLSKDNVYFLYHNPIFKDGFKKFNFKDLNSTEIEKIKYKKTGQKIPKLEEILKIFKSEKKEGQILAIDLKDFGREEELLNLIQKYDLLKSVILFSWTPQSLFKFDKIFQEKPEYKIPIFFSHTRIDSIFNHFFFTYFINLFKNFVSFKDILFLNNYTYKKDLGKFSKGYRHVVYFEEFPKDILEILEKTNGGICASVKNSYFPKWGLKYFRFFKNHNLKVAVYGTFFGILKLDRKKFFENLAKQKEIDIVFMDDLSDIL